MIYYYFDTVDVIGVFFKCKSDNSKQRIDPRPV